MQKNFYRTELLIGKENLAKIQKTRILVLGLGGVGGTALEALSRMGFCDFVLADFDVIDETNLNRQILTLEENIGRKKALVAQERVLAINSRAKVEIFDGFVDLKNIEQFLPFDIVVDAIDSVRAKVEILAYLWHKKIPVFSSMGAGFRKDLRFIKIADIFETDGCRLARYVRKNLKKHGVTGGIKCVYSDEEVGVRTTEKIGSLVTITSMFGLLLAQLVFEEVVEGAVEK